MEPFEVDPSLTQIYNLLYRLGVGANICGFRYLSCAIRLSLERPERLDRISRELYPEIARLYCVQEDDVRKEIRRVISIIWTRNPQAVERLARQSLRQKPSPKQFIASVCRHFVRNEK